ncbi:MAG: class I SAM-dependent methyltransferase [Candidatus Cloacimonetes bacterium]|nr:class I SAM-dependent methyltransferase [Candidatus Cloacimonadota bacterium]
MNTKDPYLDFASRYDLMQKENPFEDKSRLEFYRKLFDRYNVKKILDCSCGTGSDLIRIKSLGFDIFGSDISEAMLNIAKEKIASYVMEIPLEKKDFRHLSGHFDAVLCMTTSLPHLIEKKEILAALTSMRNVLNPDGILVLSQGMTDKQYAQKLRFFPIRNTPSHSRVMIIDYLEDEWEVHVLDLVHTADEQSFHRSSFRYRLLLRDDYHELLREAGFTKLEFYGDFNFSSYDIMSSNQLIIVAQK